MKIEERLSYFLQKNFGNSKDFYELTGILQSQFSRYLTGRSLPGIEALRKFYDNGLNLNWLVSGNGSMFADNGKGHELNIKFETEHESDKLIEIKSRINQWIIENFNTIKKFAEETEISLEIIDFEIEGNTYPSPIFLNCLKTAGCNLEWITYGTGNKYLNNPGGYILKSRKEFPLTSKDEEKSSMDAYLKKIENRIIKTLKNELNKFETEE